MDCALPELLSDKAVDVITINDEEARQLSGEYSLVKAAKSKLWPKYVVIKKGNTVLYCFMIFRFSAPALPLEEVLIQQEGRYFVGAGFITQSENVSFENMKNAIIYGSNLASLCREIWDRKND
jgi:hypothetical protein